MQDQTGKTKDAGERAVRELRRQARAEVGVPAVLLALSTVSAIIAAASVGPLIVRGDPNQWLLAVVDGLRWIATYVGLDLIAAAPWIVPSLMAIVFGIFASSYVSRELFRSVPAPENRDAQAEASAKVGIVATVVCFLTIDYFAVACIAAVSKGRHLGDVIAIGVFGAIIFVSAGWAGGLALRPPEGLEELAKKSRSRIEERIHRLGAFNARRLTSRQALLRLLLWLVAPIFLAIVMMYFGGLIPGDNRLYWQWLSLIVGVAAGVNFYAAWTSWMLREAAPSHWLGKIEAYIQVAMVFIFVTVVVAVFCFILIGPTLIQLVMTIIFAVLLLAVAAAWSAPAELLRRSHLLWHRTPAFALDSLVRNAADRRNRKARAQVKRVDEYAELLRRKSRREMLPTSTLS